MTDPAAQRWNARQYADNARFVTDLGMPAKAWEKYLHIGWRLSRAAAVALLPVVAGCTAFDTPDTYNRHRLSDVTLPRDGGTDMFFFDVTVTAEFPDDNAAAEAERMKWLGEWLQQRHMCPTGYEIIEKRKFEFTEDNPARRDLRYEARCNPG